MDEILYRRIMTREGYAYEPVELLIKVSHLKFLSQAILEAREKILEEVNMGIRRLSGQWEAQTIEWIKGNKKAFMDIIKFIELTQKQLKK